MFVYIYIHIYLYIFLYIYNHKNNMPSQLSPQWPCGNSATRALGHMMYATVI